MDWRETSFADMFIDGAIMLAREGARITKLYMPTRDFLWLAWQSRVDDPAAPPRPVMRPARRGTTDWVNSQPSPAAFRFPEVRVSDRINLQAPWGAVEIVEDKEA